MNKTLKRIIPYIVALATVAGTYIGNTGGFPPFYTRKSGTSGGICVGLPYTRYEPGSNFYGINLAGAVGGAGNLNGIVLTAFGNVETNQPARINGLKIGLFNAPIHLIPILDFKNLYKGLEEQRIDLSGLEISLVNITRHLAGLQIGACNYARSLSGLEIGLYNDVKSLSGMQIGIYNNSEESLAGLQIGLINRAMGDSRSGFGINIGFGRNDGR